MRCPDPKFVWPNGKVIAVPCGKCVSCLHNKRDDWSIRLLQEHKVSKSAYFITLTYNEKYYPLNGLSKRHLQLYFKRVRKSSPKLRYYAVGEYGSKTKRAHYHAIVFNASEEVLRACWSLKNGRTGKQEPIGLVHVGSVNEASVRYTTKYVVQKGNAQPDLNQPFALMSRAYGLGLSYLTDPMVKWHRDGGKMYYVEYGKKRRLPRYYKEKIWPASDWSNWKWRREQVFKEARLEAEKRDKDDLEELKRLGIKDPEIFRIESLKRSASIGKKKVSHSQKY